MKLMCEKGVFFAGVVAEFNFSVPSVNAALKWLQFYRNNLMSIVFFFEFTQSPGSWFVIEVVFSSLSWLFIMKRLAALVLSDRLQHSLRNVVIAVLCLVAVLCPGEVLC